MLQVTLCIFDFIPDQGRDERHFHPKTAGQLRMNIQFADALDETVNVNVYAKLYNTI